MEAQTATTPSAAATGSKTLADLLPLAVEKHADKVAQRYKDQSKGEWVDVSYPELGEIAKEVTLGLQELGIDRGDKVGILANTRPEWTYADFGILATGATVVPIYQTNSPEECHYVLDHSESVAVILEDQASSTRSARSGTSCPKLEHVISMEPLDGDDVISLDELREKGRGRSDEDYKQRIAAVEGSDVATYIYTSGTTGPPKGCVIDHQNWRDMLDMVQTQNVLMEDEVAYLFLPLAHAFARLIQLGSLDVGATIVYWERDPQKIIPNLMEVKPTYFPSVPRMFEKIYSMAISNAPDKAQLEQAVKLGDEGAPDAGARRDRSARAAGGLRQGRRGAVPERPQHLRRPHQAGGHRRGADRAGDPRVLLRVRRARAGGLGHDRDLDRGDDATPPRRLPVRVGRQAVPRRRGQDRRRRRDPRSRAEHLPRLLQEPGRDRGDDRRRLAAHRRHRHDRRGRLPLHHRPQEGHHHHGRRQEHHARRTSRTASSRTSTSHRRSCTATGGPS